MGNGALSALARRVGMRNFAPMPAWGFSRISAADQTSFFLGIDRFVVRRHRGTAMRLLSTIVRLAALGGRPRAAARVGAVLQGRLGLRLGRRGPQVALLRRGKRRLSLAVLTTGNPGHEYGKTTLEVSRVACCAG